MSLDTHLIREAAALINRADAIFIGAGAGMGVDSGLPDFRGNEGFWQAYPPYRSLGLSFVEMANPEGFYSNPPFAWGFYGHRLTLYRATSPHDGFYLLKQWGKSKSNELFVFTSNVDGQFQKAGFAEDSILECHGSIHHLQCTKQCGVGIWSAANEQIVIDHNSMQAEQPLPRCPNCGAMARPNILMFGDWDWDSQRSDIQESRFQEWVKQRIKQQSSLVVIEIGAGLAVPTVRYQCENIARHFQCPLIRINPRDAQGSTGTISLAGGCLEVLEQINRVAAA